jgi:lipopolysaccharide transport system ATP-binding protein
MPASTKNKPIIEVSHLSKEYVIGVEKTYKTLSECATNLMRHPLTTLKDTIKPKNTFWALKDINFAVDHGEVIGIIGRNGAGKSTLLKVLARITHPTEGKVHLRGHVGSLLEVGTGFHPELTGRENIYFNGSILGMKKKEIDDKFDEIVKFSGVEKYLDTPVKRYSSGMNVRLAFSVAAHLDPEILLVDEVLAVGDAEFQKKCLGKMKDVSATGRTIIFVSHDMNAIRNLCQRTIWLKDGKIHQTGDVYEVTSAYLRDSLRAKTLSDIPTLIDALPKDPAIKIDDIQIRQSNLPTNTILNGESFEVIINYRVLQRTIGLLISLNLYDERENLVIGTYHDDGAEAIQIMEPGDYCSIATMPANILAHRNYEICIGALIFNVRCCTGSPGEGIRIPIYVESSNVINKGYPENALQYRPLVQPIIPWKTKLCEEDGL